MMRTLNRFFIVCLFAISLLWHVPLSARDPGSLDILAQDYPRAFFFRATESAYNKRRFPTFESWCSQFDRLQGIIGKCLDEECVGREPRNAQFFSRFKQEHPNQVVLLHFNGNARDPRYQAERYFPGHWIYRRAVEITRDIPAELGQTVIAVADTSTFHVGGGRYKTSNDDIALFRVTSDGKHDWNDCEQVQLVAVDTKANTITVKRGCYGTKPLDFQAGNARAATHVVEGPWGKNNHIMWFYNYATHCPRDADGKTCSDRLVDDLADWFGPKGVLEAFDGLEFDVMHNETHGDTDGDGVEDNGIVDGVNQYGIGMVEFARQLRQRMSDDFIIQGDGALGPGGVRSQRAFGILNGIESEGWPNLNDWDFDDWSGGLNRHFFWQSNARAPAFNYVNHKWVEPIPGKPGMHTHPQVPFARHRLAFAATQFFDAMVCYSFAPRSDTDGKFGVWDELRCGTDNQIAWLGSPEANAKHLAWQTQELLQGTGRGASLAKRITGNVATSVTEDGVRIAARDPDSNQLRFTIQEVPTGGSELCLALTMLGSPMRACPREMARFAQVGVSGGLVDLMADTPVEVGVKLRGAKQETPLDTALGASFRAGLREIAGERKPSYFVHPPYKDKRGYTYWEQETEVPADAELRFLVGMGPLSPQRSDGVRFEVHVAPVNARDVAPFEKIFETTTNQHQWLPQSVSLRPFGGKRVRFKFVADCGPADNATTDHAHWAEVMIVKAGATTDSITPYVQYMTWLNDRPFTSSFYYRDIRSDSVDVSIVVENTEDILLRSLEAYAHCDAMYRVFERGLVLANPSRSPYTFDLEKLTPGRTYRRIQGVPTQDPATNNGQPVGARVTLGDRDALFLVRER